MNKKTIFLTLLLIIMTGCMNKTYDDNEDNINYNLSIGEVYNEKIYINLNEDDFEKVDNYEAYGTSLVNEEIYPIFSNYDIKYDKDVEKNNDYTKVILSYDYSSEEFIKSKLIMTCFEDYEIIDNDKYIYVKLSGNFYCSNNKNVNIYVKTSYKVDSCNGSKNGNSCYFNIDNLSDVDIEYKVLKEKNNILIYVLIGIIILVLGSFSFTFSKRKKRNHIRFGEKNYDKYFN